MMFDAPAAFAWRSAASRCAFVSVRNGRIGIMNTEQSSPRSRTAVTVARRAAVDGVPGSTACCSSSS